eukprot:6213876-Pleurochrysis_carterae.AAC.4
MHIQIAHILTECAWRCCARRLVSPVRGAQVQLLIQIAVSVLSPGWKGGVVVGLVAWDHWQLREGGGAAGCGDGEGHACEDGLGGGVGGRQIGGEGAACGWRSMSGRARGPVGGAAAGGGGVVVEGVGLRCELERQLRRPKGDGRGGGGAVRGVGFTVLGQGGVGVGGGVGVAAGGRVGCGVTRRGRVQNEAQRVVSGDEAGRERRIRVQRLRLRLRKGRVGG